MRSMNSRDFVVQELAHIDAMVLQLERLNEAGPSTRKATVVLLPDYWRTRIDAIADIPPSLQPLVCGLRARLNAIDMAAASRNRRN